VEGRRKGGREVQEERRGGGKGRTAYDTLPRPRGSGAERGWAERNKNQKIQSPKGPSHTYAGVSKQLAKKRPVMERGW